uniref:Uncharacterized protein n=1 Tax=Terrapene triunguis TaxID=2587831 RepID=A0A674JS12_9SAUR
MMEEISIVVAYNSHIFSQLHDEDFLASLVAISKPKSVVVNSFVFNTKKKKRRDKSCISYPAVKS